MREKTATISFRISERALKALEEDAKKQNISLNTLANQLFSSYAEFDRYINRFEMVKISVPTLKRVIGAATEKAIEEAGDHAGSSVPPGFMLARSGEITGGTVLEYLGLMGAYSNLFDYSEVVHNGAITVTLTHELGAKGSLFLLHYVQSIFKLVGKEPKFRVMDDVLSFEV